MTILRNALGLCALAGCAVQADDHVTTSLALAIDADENDFCVAADEWQEGKGAFEHKDVWTAVP